MTGALLVLLLVGLVLASLWSIIDASLQPDRAYATAGVSKPLVTTMLILGCVVGAVPYWLLIRPRLRRAIS